MSIFNKNSDELLRDFGLLAGIFATIFTLIYSVKVDSFEQNKPLEKIASPLRDCSLQKG
jgi:hypothetical protein